MVACNRPNTHFRSQRSGAPGHVFPHVEIYRSYSKNGGNMHRNTSFLHPNILNSSFLRLDRVLDTLRRPQVPTHPLYPDPGYVTANA